MSKPSAQLQAALHRIDDRWDDARTERTLESLHGKQTSRRRRRQLLSAATALCVLGFVGWQLRSESTLGDGSQVTLLDTQSRVITRQSTDTLVELELEAGHARFEVTPNKQRLFRVRSGEVTIEVLGTAFEVERQAERSHVVVLRGRVAVRWNGGESVLSAREAGWFPRGGVSEPAAPEEPREAAPPAPKPAPATHKRARPIPAPAATAAASGGWRETAEAGDFEHAYELLQRTPLPLADSVEELLLAADTARLSGHPRAALPFLKRVISDHANDSRAPLAAFTLGGILMQQLGQPHEAEAAYARARELSPSSALAEDAMARQVEAASRAGDSARAAALANEYLTHYPAGRRVHAVRRFGNLSAD